MKLRYLFKLRTITYLAAAATLSSLVRDASATITLPEMIRSGAVLQQKKKVNIWGGAAPGESVTVTYTRPDVTRQGTTVTDANGYWILQLDLTTVAASPTPGTLAIKGTNTFNLTNIYVGEVWIAAGQSNMQMCPGWFEGRSGPPTNPLIRTIRSNTRYSETPSTDLPGDPKWGSSTLYMSTVALHFATQLHQQLNGIPIGFIQIAYSGTPIRAFISKPALESDPVGREVIDLYANAEENQAPASIFNAMVNPVLPYTVRGVIWYQGENDTNDPGRYATLFPLLISSWRSHFQDANLPFYFVQLPGFNTPGEGWVGVRKVQENVSLSVPKTGMTVIHDIGDPTSIHPPDKEIVGQRLANIALVSTYGVTGIVSSGPSFDHAEFGVNGTNKVRLHFKNIAGGLQMQATEAANFQLAGPDGVYSTAASAVLDPATNTVEVSSGSVASPKFVRFAWINYNKKSSLRNGAGLPCPPFQAKSDVLEAEILNHSGVSAGDTTGVATHPVYSNELLRVFSANAIGDFITFPIPVTTIGNYYIKVGYKRYTTRGQCRLFIDDSQQGGTLDQYGNNAMLEADFGVKSFATTGLKQFKFTVPSKNPASTGYGLSFDYIKLQKQ